MCQGSPDVCTTPVPSPAGPVPTPIPYVNISNGSTAIPPTTAMKVLVLGMPALNMNTKIGTSNGDEPGVQMGVASGMIMGPTDFLMGSTKAMIGGAPAVKLTSQTGHNGMSMNCPGTALAPSQTKVLLLS